MELGPQVVDEIARYLVGKADDIQCLTQTQSGFELWLTCEALLACRTRTDWEVDFTPSYRSEPDCTGSGCGDLRVKGAINGEERWAFFEIVLIHDGNRHNYPWQRKKLRDDVKKLRTLPWTYDLPLLMVFDSSMSDVEHHWLTYLEGLPISSTLFHRTHEIRFPQSGRMTMHVFGICRPGSGCDPMQQIAPHLR